MISRRSLITSSVCTVASLNAKTGWTESRDAPSSAALGEPVVFVTGGLFPGTFGHPVFGKYLLALSRKNIPKVCYIGAAEGDCPDDVASFRNIMAALPCDFTSFNLFNPSTLDFLDYLMGVDIVFVGGGSTRNLMALWREWGFDKAVVEAWRAGVVMSGASAGALCWYQDGLSDSYQKVLSAVRGLGILPGSADVHHHTRPDRITQFQRFIADGSLSTPGLALDEAVGALYRGATLVELVSAKPGDGALRVTRTPNGAAEEPLPVRLLTG